MERYKNVKILVVDDSRPIRDHVKCILRKMGITLVAEAANGLEALERIEESEFHLIVCDWIMPEMDGISLLRTIKANGGAPADIPFIFITSQHSSSEVHEAMKLGAASFVVKPFSEYLLMSRIEKLLAHRFGRDLGAVLLVEPSGPTLKFTSSLLVELGASRVRGASDGRQALDSLQGDESLVLTSLVLPDMGISEFISELEKKMEHPLSIPVVALTCLEFSADREGGEYSGIAGWVSKPFTRDSLAEVVVPIINDARRRRWEGEGCPEELTAPFIESQKTGNECFSSRGELTALVVDDSRAMRILLHSHLKAAGFHRIIEAEDGVEALERISPELSIIFCDWLMPQMSGIEVLRRVRAMEPPVNSIPFVMITGCKDKASIVTALESGVNDYIVKPVEEESLKRKIFNLIGQMLSD